jgi:D-arginine dehydrogenase
MTDEADYIVIGAGIAGASVACELAKSARVILLEREDQPGYHATGRSAAVFTEIYGNAAIRALTVASAPFFDNPPEEFEDDLLWSPRALMMIARPDQMDQLQSLYANASLLVPTLRLLDADEVAARAPMLRAGYAAGGLLEEGSSDLDVHAIHQGFLRGARAYGARIAPNAEVRAMRRAAGRWIVETKAGTFGARVIVNAAGAWADEVAGLIGAAPIGLVPKRRSAFTFTPEPAQVVADWPTIIDISEEFYFKPEAGKLLGSPGDETPSPPCDARPEELDLAVAIDRIGAAVDFHIRTIDSKWAGLRSFVADKTPVVGYDDRIEGFFWLAAQGGYGIQTSPAISRAAAALLQERAFPEDLTALGVNETTMSPRRLRKSRGEENAARSAYASAR